MTRSLSVDLRGRVIAAIEDGLSTREAARRFQIGISTAGEWYRRYRQTGETSGSKLDPHEDFIFSLIEDQPEITLEEIAEALANNRGTSAVASTVWVFLDRRGITFKKRQHMPPSSKDPMSCAAEGPGSTANLTSIQPS